MREPSNTGHDKGLGDKASAPGITPAAQPSTPATPVVPSPAPAPTRSMPVPPMPTPATPAAPATASPTGPVPTPAAPAAHVGHRRRARHAHPAAPAPAATPASADSDTEPEGSEETEQTPPTDAAIAAAVKQLREEAAKKKEERKLKNRIKRAPKAFGKWLKAWCKKHKFLTAILVIAIIASTTMWVNGKFSDENAGSGSSGSGIGESTVSKGIRPDSGTRADQFFPKLSIDGDKKVLTFEDPTAPTSLKMTFQVTVDKDNTITQVDLSDSMLKYGFVKFGTTNRSDKPAGYCKEKSCDFADKPVNLCETWMFEQRQIPAAGGSEFAARYWSAKEYDQATTNDSSEQIYPGDSGGSSRLCGGKY